MEYKNSDIKRKPGTVPRPGEGKRGPQGHLGYLVRQASVAVRAAMEKALADIAMTPQTINVIVRNLERMGAIRKSADAEHGRILRLTATAKGQALLKRCRARVAQVDDRLAALAGRDDEKVVRRWLSAVGEALGKG
jgi:DNA-binding MarR family transcriptional regulator